MRMQLLPRKQQPSGSGPQSLTLRDAMNQLFDESFWDPMRFLSEGTSLPAIAQEQWQFFPSFDISETDKHLQIIADVPGYDPANVSVNLENGVLTIQGTMEEEKEEKGKKWYRREASRGNFFRQLSLPQGIDEKSVKCKMRNGKLMITVSKPSEVKPSGKTLQIETE